MSQNEKDAYSVLRSMSQASGVTPTMITAFLKATSELNGYEVRVLLDEEKLAAGASAETILFDLETDAPNLSGGYVLRLARKEDAIFQQTSLEQDWDVLEALKATGFEAPDAVWIGSIGDIPAMVVRRIIAPAPSIKFLEEGPFATGTAQLRGRMIENFVRTAADLHQISLARLGLTRLSQRGGPEGHFIDREINWVLAEFHSRFPAEEDGDRAPLHGEIRSNIDRVADLLRRHAPRHRTPVLVHGDYTLANVMFRDDGSIAALLDWELAHEGLPEEDIANAVVSAQSRAALGNPLSEFPSLAELAPMYQRFHPLPDTDWDFAALFASFRSTTWGAIGTRRFPPEFWPKQKLVWDAQKSILNRLANDFLKKKGIQSEQF